MAFTTIGPSIPAQAASGNMQITPIDFGDAGVWGDSTMLSSGGKNLLMDTYIRDSYDTLINYLDDHHFYTFDLYLSHYHYDHMDQFTAILEDSRFNVGTVYLPDPAYVKKGAQSSSYCQSLLDGHDNIVDAANDNGSKIVYLKKGSSFTVGNAKVNVLWGCTYSSSSYDASYINNNSLVTKVTSGTVSYLTCGDIESEVENQLVSSGINLSADIFKFNHHGGNSSNTSAFVKKVNPSFAYYNWLGDSPTSFGGGWVQTPINNLKNTCNIYSTRYNGMLTFTVKAGHISVAGERNMVSVNAKITDSSGNVVNTVNYQFNDALDYHITAAMKSTAATVAASDASTALPTRYAYIAKFIETSGGTKYRNKDGSYSTNKFQTIDGDTYYFDENGYVVTGFRKIDGKTYYFDSNGIMLLRWKRINGKKYYFDPTSGYMHTGWEWVSEKNAWYYLSPETGYLLEGWIIYKGKKYYLAPTEYYAVTGWNKIDGKWYYFDPRNADMKTGWLTLGTKTYYLGNDGVMVTGTQNIDGKTYTFAASGVLNGQPPANTSSSGSTSTASSASASNGWEKIDGKWYYRLNGSYLKSCFQRINGYTYYLDENGIMLTGFQKIDGKTYYFETSGHMLIGWKRIDGKKYYFDPVSGYMHTGWEWVTENNAWYYLSPENGYLLEGWITYKNKKYYLAPTYFFAVTGWNKIDGKWYYFDPKNADMKTGWLTLGTKTYYLGTDGIMVTGTHTINGKTYSFADSGVLNGQTSASSSGSATTASGSTTGWEKVDGKWKYKLNGTYLTSSFKVYNGNTFYLDENGNMVTGFRQIGGKTYYFEYPSGHMLRGWNKIDGKWYYFDPSNADMKTGWLKLGTKTYYLGTDGVMVTGTQTIDGKTYTFADSGLLTGQTSSSGSATTASGSTTGWVKVNGYWKYLLNSNYLTSCFRAINGYTYYLDENGIMLTGFQEIGGKTYYFEDSGHMLLRWKRIDGKKYYFDPVDGHMHTGWEWVSENSAWYYLSPETGYLLEGWITYKNKKYYLAPTDFYAVTGWNKIDGKWYYFDPKNADMKTGWLTLGTKTYYLGTDGVMVTGTQSIDGKTYTFASSGVLSGEAPAAAASGSSSQTTSAASWNLEAYATTSLTDIWAKGTDSDMSLDYTTKRNTAFVNTMLAYATYFVDKIDYASSVTNDDPTGLRFKRLKSGGKTDCSWFVYHVLYKFGLVGEEFIHSYQWGNDPSTYPGGVNIGTDVSKASPGDIICTGKGTESSNSHVMIYLGGGKVVECAAGYGVIISGAPSTARQIVHFECLPNNPSASYKETTYGTWVTSGGNYMFKVGYAYLSNRFQNINGEIYYFDKNGICATGWQTIDGKKYCFKSGGQMYLRWKRIDGKKYYFDPISGYMHTGWEWVSEQNAWYYLDPTEGYLVSGWQEINGKKYYFDSDNKMVTGTQTIDGVTYTFNNNGALIQ